MAAGHCWWTVWDARACGRAGLRLCLAVLLLLASRALAIAGAWTLPPAQSEFWSTTTIASAGSAFGPGYALQTGTAYTKVEQTIFGEMGMADGITVILGSQFLAISVDGSRPSTYAGMGYTDFGARVRLWEDGGGIVSMQVIGRAPGAAGSANPAAIGYTQWEADFRLLAGFSFMLLGMPAFVDLQIAQRQRWGDPPDEARLDLTVGAEVAPGWKLMAQSFNVISEGAGTGPDFDLSYAYYKGQVAALVEIDPHMRVGLAAFTTYLARNFPQENGLVLWVNYRF